MQEEYGHVMINAETGIYDPRIAKDGWQILGTEAWKSSGY